MGSTEVSTHRSENSWFRKSPSFPRKSNLKESFPSSETISPNSQSCASSRGWQQESKSSSQKGKLIGWVFLPPNIPGKTFVFCFFFFLYKHLSPLLLYLQHSHTDMKLFLTQILAWVLSLSIFCTASYFTRRITNLSEMVEIHFTFNFLFCCMLLKSSI